MRTFGLALRDLAIIVVCAVALILLTLFVLPFSLVLNSFHGLGRGGQSGKWLIVHITRSSGQFIKHAGISGGKAVAGTSKLTARAASGGYGYWSDHPAARAWILASFAGVLLISAALLWWIGVR